MAFVLASPVLLVVLWKYRASWQTFLLFPSFPWVWGWALPNSALCGWRKQTAREESTKKKGGEEGEMWAQTDPDCPFGMGTTSTEWSSPKGEKGGQAQPGWETCILLLQHDVGNWWGCIKWWLCLGKRKKEEKVPFLVRSLRYPSGARHCWWNSCCSPADLLKSLGLFAKWCAA